MLNRLRWQGQVMRLSGSDFKKKIMLAKPASQSTSDRPKVKFISNMKEDLKNKSMEKKSRDQKRLVESYTVDG